MMIRTGIDIIEVKRIKKAIEKNKSFTHKIFTDLEREYCESRKKGRFASYAGIYAAKEAFVKALGLGFRKGTWHELEVTHNPLGAPMMSVSGVFLEYMDRIGYSDIQLSISHSKDYAMSLVILTQ